MNAQEVAGPVVFLIFCLVLVMVLAILVSELIRWGRNKPGLLREHQKRVHEAHRQMQEALDDGERQMNGVVHGEVIKTEWERW